MSNENWCIAILISTDENARRRDPDGISELVFEDSSPMQFRKEFDDISFPSGEIMDFIDLSGDFDGVQPGAVEAFRSFMNLRTFDDEGAAMQDVLHAVVTRVLHKGIEIGKRLGANPTK